MTDLDAIRQTYYEATSRVSEVARNLGLAGIAIVWLLSGANVNAPSGIHISHQLLVVGLMLVIGLALDLLHAAYRAAIWGLAGRHWERQGTRKGINIPLWMNWPSSALLWLKLAAVAAAYVLMGIDLAQRLT